jgi:hypothetical protein
MLYRNVAKIIIDGNTRAVNLERHNGTSVSIADSPDLSVEEFPSRDNGILLRVHVNSTATVSAVTMHNVVVHGALTFGDINTNTPALDILVPHTVEVEWR